jgi:hypothetical protein
MIKKIFWEFYHPDSSDIKKAKQQGTYVFDACSLLEIYKLPTKKRKILFEKLVNLSKNNRVWLPYQFVKEYLKNREKVLKEEVAKYDKTAAQLNELRHILESNVKKHNFDVSDRHLNIDTNLITEKVIKSLNANIDRVTKELDQKKKKHPNWLNINKDPIHIKIDKYFKIEPAYSYEVMKIVKTKIKSRIDLNIKPGLTDQGKTINKDGDILAWLQMLEHAKKTKKPVILISQETKPDWYESYTNGAINMPSRSLVREMHEFSGQIFHVIGLYEFLGDTNLQPPSETINNIEVAVTGSSVIGSKDIEQTTNNPVVMSK